MPGLYAHTTRANGTTLTAAIYNADHENHITNDIPTMMDDYSTNAAEMQTTSDPGEIGSESLATTMAGELERLRFAILEIKQALNNTITQWYQSPQQMANDLMRLPPWYIEGLDFRIGPTKCGMVQVATGWCRDSSDTINMRVSTPIVKGVTALWASQVATGAGGQGVTFALYGQHNVFVIKTGASTFDIGFDISNTAANLMARASGTYYRRIGVIWGATVGGTTTPALQVICRHGRHVYFGTDFIANATYRFDGIACPTDASGLPAGWCPLTPTGIRGRVEGMIGFEGACSDPVFFFVLPEADGPTGCAFPKPFYDFYGGQAGYMPFTVIPNTSDATFHVVGADKTANSFASVPMSAALVAWQDFRKSPTG